MRGWYLASTVTSVRTLSSKLGIRGRFSGGWVSRIKPNDLQFPGVISSIVNIRQCHWTCPENIAKYFLLSYLKPPLCPFHTSDFVVDPSSLKMLAGTVIIGSENQAALYSLDTITLTLNLEQTFQVVYTLVWDPELGGQPQNKHISHLTNDPTILPLDTSLCLVAPTNQQLSFPSRDLITLSPLIDRVCGMVGYCHCFSGLILGSMFTEARVSSHLQIN